MPKPVEPQLQGHPAKLTTVEIRVREGDQTSINRIFRLIGVLLLVAIGVPSILFRLSIGSTIPSSLVTLNFGLLGAVIAMSYLNSWARTWLQLRKAKSSQFVVAIGNIAKIRQELGGDAVEPPSINELKHESRVLVLFDTTPARLEALNGFRYGRRVVELSEGAEAIIWCRGSRIRSVEITDGPRSTVLEAKGSLQDWASDDRE